jgi:hypothetical protein
MQAQLWALQNIAGISVKIYLYSAIVCPYGPGTAPALAEGNGMPNFIF